jgi:prepilin-type N-terminal cleavage/methylation domain-containing protein
MRYPMRRLHRGFTLIEVAISMVILGLVLTGLVVSLSQQLQQRRLLDTRTTLQNASDALMAFVTANARLPCPAIVGSNGLEATAGGPGTCAAAAGFLPAVTLGLPNLDGNGLLNDGWADGSIVGTTAANPFPRAIRYSVTLLAGTTSPNALTTAKLNGVSRQNVGLALAANNGLFVCRSHIGIGGGGNRCGAIPANYLAVNAVAVIWSQGPTGYDSAGNSADEAQNANVFAGAGVGRAFVMRDPTDPAAASGRFDDLVSWIPWGVVADKLMIAAQVP